MSFEHRKYHGLYFILGFIIAAMLVMLLGCKPAETTSGISYPPPPPCCAAFIPECMACQEGISVCEWEEKTCGEADVMGCDEENGWMCGLVIID